MKYGRLNRLFPITMAILVVALIGLSGCTESAGSSFVVPTFTEPGPPPIEVTVEQLYQEYMADEAAADAKYKGERLLFSRVRVEEVINFFYIVRPIEFYILNGSVKFLPRYPSDVESIRLGFVVDIIGEAQGIIFGILIVKDCWINIVEEADYVEPGY